MRARVFADGGEWRKLGFVLVARRATEPLVCSMPLSLLHGYCVALCVGCHSKTQRQYPEPEKVRDEIVQVPCLLACLLAVLVRRHCLPWLTCCVLLVPSVER